MSTADRLVPPVEVARLIGYSRSKLDHMVRDGEFPQPIRINSRCVRWRESVVQQWIDQLEADCANNPVPVVCGKGATS
ncbi:MAG: transcriptional regulator [Halioglobus sp.]|nr:transcriptional regulator [Halioglobus sp.]